MSAPLSIILEPKLEFRFEQKLQDPHDGLALFGPYDTDSSSHIKSIPYAVIGTPEGLAAFELWSKAMNLPAVSVNKDENVRLWPPFPGFEAVYHSTWPNRPAWKNTLDRNTVLTASKNWDPNRRAYEVVEQYLSAIKIAKKRDESFGLIICVIPEQVWQNCRPESRVAEGVGQKVSKFERRLRAQGQEHLFDKFHPQQYQLSVDFRRQIKARTMEFGIPIQIIRESTLQLSPESRMDSRDLTPLSDRMWNLSTSCYYKAGGKPWRLSTARVGVCYIGIAFRRTDLSMRGRTACCAAQMFLDTGDGIVFLGESGPWYSPVDKQCHLSKEAAGKLLTGVLKTYKELDGRELREIFLHSRSTIDAHEFDGYRRACPNGTRIIGVRVRPERHGIQLFRKGKWPVIRGTFLKIDERSAYLWASGFKPELGTYDGWEIPVPLRIDVEHGDADIVQVTTDIFGLTKLNYNACKLGDSQPVTVGFSDAVGEILVSNPVVSKRSPNFKFYI